MSSEEAILKILKDTENHKGIWIFAEVRHGKMQTTAYELLGVGRKLADELGEPLSALIMGNNLSNDAQELIERGADKVYMMEHALLEQFVDELYANLVVDLMIKEKPNKFLLPASTIGRSFGSRVAVLANTGITADATELGINKEKGNLLNAIRPSFGGTLMATILCIRGHRPEMATIRPMAFPQAAKQEGRKGEIIKVSVDPSKFKQREKHIRFEADKNKEVDIQEATIIVSGGYGLGGPEGFEPLRKIAHTLGAALGASRKAVDAGWIPYRHQVGLTGRTVRPKLYIAVGISGQIQHLAGMNSSGTIVAINEDAEAPMVKLASYAVVGDLFQILPAFQKELENIGYQPKEN